MRPLFKLTCLLTLGFVLCIGLIRAQPYDGSQLHDFLASSDDCALPCFMGIKPGETTFIEAVNLLETNPWVADVQVHELTVDNIAVTWQWNDSLPIPDDHSRVSELRTSRRVVQAIILSTGFQFGDLWLSLENREDGYFLYMGAQNVPPPYPIHYVNRDIRIITLVNCADFWQATSTIALGSFGVEPVTRFGITSARGISCASPLF